MGTGFYCLSILLRAYSIHWIISSFLLISFFPDILSISLSKSVCILMDITSFSVFFGLKLFTKPPLDLLYHI